jgi:hypothetical protein
MALARDPWWPVTLRKDPRWYRDPELNSEPGSDTDDRTDPALRGAAGAGNRDVRSWLAHIEIPKAMISLKQRKGPIVHCGTKATIPIRQNSS